MHLLLFLLLLLCLYFVHLHFLCSLLFFFHCTAPSLTFSTALPLLSLPLPPTPLFLCDL
jgi:hypothetical protein